MGIRGHQIRSALSEEEDKRTGVTSDWSLAKWIIGYLRDYKALVVIALILVVIGTLVNLVSPLLMKYLIDDVFKSTTLILEDKNKLLLYLTLGLLVTTIITSVFNVLRIIVLYKIGYNTVKKIRTDTFAHLQSLSMKYIDNQEAANTRLPCIPKLMLITPETPLPIIQPALANNTWKLVTFPLLSG